MMKSLKIFLHNTTTGAGISRYIKKKVKKSEKSLKKELT